MARICAISWDFIEVVPLYNPAAGVPKPPWLSILKLAIR
jgi:hypothetical protein